MRIFAIIILCVVFLALMLMCFGASAQTTEFSFIRSYYAQKERPTADTVKATMLITMHCSACTTASSYIRGYKVTHYTYNEWDISYGAVEIKRDVFYLSSSKERLPEWVKVWICEEFKE